MSEKQEQKNEDIREFGQVALNNNRENNRISLLTIIGEIEGHEDVYKRQEQAAPLGVYLHGKAGEAAGARRSMRGMTASDIHDGMCEILAGLEQTQSQPGKDGIS